MKILQMLIIGTVLTAGALAPTAMSQAADATKPSLDETTFHGTVVAVSNNTLLVRTRDNIHQLFTLDRDTVKPDAIAPGAEVTITSISTSEPNLRLARVITLGGETAEHAKPGEESASGQQPAPVPASTKRLQNDIERHMRHFVFGVRGGVGMDPEVLIIGGHARMGPIFHQNIQFRPSAEFGFGEVTKFFDINPDVSYRLPLTPHWSSWSTYVAAGPALGFSQQHFEKGSTGLDWGNLEFTPGLNIVAGLESRRGFLMEFRSTVYASPNPIFRLMFGYSF